MTPLVSLLNVHSMVDRLTMGGLVITSNQRLASRLLSAYTIHQQQLGRAVIQQPRVFSLDAWVQQCWRQLLLSADSMALSTFTLSAAQEQLLWEQIIQNSDVALMRTAAAAQQASSAYRTLRYWQQPLSSQRVRDYFVGDEDASVFLQWADQFEKTCAAQGFHHSSQRFDIIIDAYQQGTFAREESIGLLGFESLSPLENNLLALMGDFEHLQGSAQPAAVSKLACSDYTEEIYAAAVWSKQQLKNHPGVTVAVVIPDLSEQRKRVQRIFQQVIEPEFSDPAIARRGLPFNISAGYPLIEAPIITAALQTLAMHLPELKARQCLSMLSSPFYCLNEQDDRAVASLATSLYESPHESINAAQFRHMASSVFAEQHWDFADGLQQQAGVLRAQKKQQRPSAWADVFKRLVELLDWPGKRKLDSEEFQQVQQWHTIVAGLSALDVIQPEMNYAQAVNALRACLSQQVFQPKTLDSSLQILGTLEAAGLEFDFLWLASMSEQQWPGNPSPNPFLPYALQRDKTMPHATAERELDYATGLLQRFIHSASTVVLSYPLSLDGNDLKPSPLITTFSCCTDSDLLGKPLLALTPLQEIRRRHIESAMVEVFDPGMAPKVTEDEIIKGGSALFASQAACPFRAFARHRLKLKAFPVPELGLSAAARGGLLHSALEKIWLILKDRASLLALDEDDKNTLCSNAAEFSLTQLLHRQAELIGPRYRELEKARLHKLLLLWLKTETERANFTVNAVEEKFSFRYAPLDLTIRIDRIDQLDDGSLLIIDYKTASSISPAQWWGARPEDPQLPLYQRLLAEKNTVAGIAFAQVNIKKRELIAVGSEVSPEPLIQFKPQYKNASATQDWQQLQLHWKKTLSALADDFIAGKAMVDPKQRPKTCDYCDYSSICRVEDLLSEEFPDEAQ